MQNEAELLHRLAHNDPDIYVRKQVTPLSTPASASVALDTSPEHLTGLAKSHSDAHRIYHITNASFREGTLRIRQSGLYLVQEDIILEPNADFDCRPRPDQAKLFPSGPGPYALGFFAGITIEADDVVLDLQGHTIQQSIRFYVLQRFFATIELSSSPFIPKQGPANFGPKPFFPRNVVIQNGIFGLSSHHAIHGNGARNILLENLTIRDFEVGGISLNGIVGARLTRIRILDSIGTRLFVPVNARFSAAVFLWRTLDRIIREDHPDDAICVGCNRWSLSKAHARMGETIRKVVEASQKTQLRRVPHFPSDISRLFGNPDGFQDCSAIYGIVFNKLGVAVDEFGACDKTCAEGTLSRDIHIQNCTVSNLIVRPLELVAFQSTTKKDGLQKDFSGSLLMAGRGTWWESDATRYTAKGAFIETDGSYDWLLATQVLLAKYSETSGLRWTKGVADISPAITQWVTCGNKPLNEFTLVTVRNTDVMGHVMKGVVGIRLDLVQNSTIVNCQVGRLRNVSPVGVTTDVLQGYIDGVNGGSKTTPAYPHTGNPKSDDTEIGYTGADIRGISLTTCTDIQTTDVVIADLESTVGSCYGYDLQHGNQGCGATRLHIRQLQAGDSQAIPFRLCFSLPNWIPRAIGYLSRYSNKECRCEEVTVHHITSVGIANAVVFEANVEGFASSVRGQSSRTPVTYTLNREGIQDTVPQS